MENDIISFWELVFIISLFTGAFGLIIKEFEVAKEQQRKRKQFDNIDD